MNGAKPTAAWLPEPALALVTDRRRCRDEADLVARVTRAVAGGVSLVQLREKDLAGGALLHLAERLRKATQGKALLFINDRVDIALACEADGVHLPEEGMPLAAVRKTAGSKLRVSRSVHTLQSAMDAVQQGIDLLVVGTIFQSTSHPVGPVGGMELVERVAKKVETPFLAIGGIKAENAALVTQAGAQGAAVITAVLNESDPTHSAARLVAALRAGVDRRAGSGRREAHY